MWPHATYPMAKRYTFDWTKTVQSKNICPGNSGILFGIRNTARIPSGTRAVCRSELLGSAKKPWRLQTGQVHLRTDAMECLLEPVFKGCEKCDTIIKSIQLSRNYVAIMGIKNPLRKP